MAIRKDIAVKSPTERIRTELKAPTQETLRYLRAVLGLESRDLCDKRPLSTRPKKADAVALRAIDRLQRRPSSKQCQKPGNAGHVNDTSQVPQQELPPKERIHLANEVFNSTLKQLAKAINRQSDESATGNALHSSRAHTFDPGTGLEVVVQCSHTALQGLRNHGTDKAQPGISKGVDLENAALVLLNRSVSLHFEIQALRQLSEIQRVYWHGLNTADFSDDTSLAQLILGRPDAADDPSRFTFTMSMQDIALRLALRLGATCVDSNLVMSLHPATVGSPAWITIRGFDNTRLEAEQAGSRLRTIALAVSKLCTIVAKSAPDKQCVKEYFNIYCLSLLIKIKSWPLLGYVPDSTVEVWRGFHHALRQGLANKADFDTISTSITDWINVIREALDFTKCPSTIPLEVFETLFEGLQQSQARMRISSWLAMDHRTVGEPDIVLACRKATLWLKIDDSQNTLSSVRSTVDLLAGGLVFSEVELIRLLPYLARLRKAAVPVATFDLTQEKRHIVQGDSSETLQIGVVDLIHAIYGFLKHNMGTALAHNSDAAQCKAAQPLLSSLLRTVDVILSLDGFSVAQKSIRRPEVEEVLRDCSITIEQIQTVSVYNRDLGTADKECYELRLRLSSRFWSLYLEAIKQGRSSESQAGILELSLQGLLALPSSYQCSAHIPLKFERLASCYREIHNFEKAAGALKNAIVTSIEQGVLSNTVEAVLAGPSHRAWDHCGSPAKALGKLLATYVRTQLARIPPLCLDQCFYDDASLPTVHRAVLLDRQILAVSDLDLRDELYRLCTRMLSRLFESLHPLKFHVYKLRCVNHLLRVGLKQRLSASTFEIDPAVISELLARTTEAKDAAYLRRFQLELGLLLELQYGLFTGTINKTRLERLVIQLTDIVNACDDLDELDCKCEDVQAWVLPLLLATDYANMIEEHRTALSALGVLEHLAKIGIVAEGLCTFGILVRKSNILLQLQELSSAQSTLAAAHTANEDKTKDPYIQIDFALTYSDYYLQVTDAKGCTHWLKQAEDIWDSQVLPAQRSLTTSFLKGQSLLCRAAYLASSLAFYQNELLSAIVFASYSSKIALSMWTVIKKVWTSTELSEQKESTEVRLQTLSGEFRKLDLASQPSSNPSLATMTYAAYSVLCCTAIVHKACLSCHCGIYSDAAAYYEQARQIVQNITQSRRGALISSELCVLHARAGQIEKARCELETLAIENIQFEMSWLQALVAINRGEAYVTLGDLTAAHTCLGEAKQPIFVRVEPVEEPAPTRVRNGGKAKRPAKVTMTKQIPIEMKDKRHIKPSFPALRTTTSILDARNVTMRVSNLETHLKLVEYYETEDNPCIGAPDCYKCPDGRGLVLLALRHVHSALSSLSDDAVHNVLAETAVALPVRYRSTAKSGRISFVQHTASRSLFAAKGKLSTPDPDEGEPLTGSTLLLQAYETLQELRLIQPGLLPSDVIHLSYKLMAQITLLSTAMGQPLALSSRQLVSDIMCPLDLMQLRQDYVTEGGLSATRRTNLQEWPTSRPSDYRHSLLDSSMKLDFDIDSLPGSWTIVCLEFDAAQNELFVARLTCGRSPFVIRIPLVRPDSSDGETEQMTLKMAKREMARIVKSANETAHSARGSSNDKSVRGAWMAERRALDKELSNLLRNIEDVWLGGFRGLLSSQRYDEARLAEFGRRLTSTLVRHLPSRQKPSKQKTPAIGLHDHVLELFTGLGHPQNVDLEDAILDVLYFVVDILQLNGEHNAYDEIDFDAMLIEVSAALHTYHDAETDSETESNHLILVLDKELQAFPWESLPCVRGRPVSRMPSLGSIWDRLSKIKSQPDISDVYKIKRNNGAYILNPGSDLKSTQATFSHLFQEQLSGYAAIVDRAPNANEFEAVLKEHDLMLYFGHGGGTHYIRPQTIRKMDKCAVTLLMGCSSAKVTEYGVYEPQGVPLSYLSGSSAAVVGNLWDVTDRDIDRFAMQLMQDWGLLDASEDSRAQALAKVSKKGNKKQANQPRDEEDRADGKHAPVSLDQAVADARDACLLRYLTGAAPVIYGVPILLE